MATWTLLELRRKVRQVTGRLSAQELSNDDLDEYINKYYQYTFPAEVKLEKFHVEAEVLTIANQQVYDEPAGFINYEPPAQLDNLYIEWYQDPIQFERQNPINILRETLGVGDGATANYTGTLTQIPVLAGTSIFTDNNEIFQDDNTDFSNSPVNLTGSLGGAGTLDYETGAYNITFNNFVADGENVVYSGASFIAGRPISVLWYDSKFTFYPVPDDVYRLRMKAYSDNLVITAAGLKQGLFVNATDRPLLDQWGPAIAYGTARDIFADFGEMDSYAEITVLYKEQLGYVLRRTNQNLLNTRATPNF